MVHASSAHTKLGVYRQRKPQDSAYYRCVEDCFETLEQVYQERFEQKYGNPGPVYYTQRKRLRCASEHLSPRNV